MVRIKLFFFFLHPRPVTNGCSDGEAWFEFSTWDETSPGVASLLRKWAGHPSGLGSQGR